MNKFLQFNEFVELGKVFKDCEAYLIALEHFNKAKFRNKISQRANFNLSRLVQI